MTTSIKSLLSFFLLFILVACVENSVSNTTASPAGDSLQAVATNLNPDLVILKDAQIDAKAVTGEAPFLTDNEIGIFSIRLIDSAFSLGGNGFKYFVVDTLYTGSSGKVLLISRQYPEENIAWAVSYDQSSRLIDKLQVYYDNSEGNLLVTSLIKHNSILVSTENTYGETPDAAKQQQVYAISERYKFTKR